MSGDTNPILAPEVVREGATEANILKVLIVVAARLITLLGVSDHLARK